MIGGVGPRRRQIVEWGTNAWGGLWGRGVCGERLSRKASSGESQSYSSRVTKGSGLAAATETLGRFEKPEGIRGSLVAPVPGLKADPLGIALGEGQNELIAGGIVNQPTVGIGLHEVVGQIRLRLTSITNVDSVARAVLGKTRWGTDFRAIKGRLITLCLNGKKQLLLLIFRAKCTQQAQADAFRFRRQLHCQKALRRLGPQLHSRGHHHQLGERGFGVGEVAQEATVVTQLGLQAGNGGGHTASQGPQQGRERRCRQGDQEEAQPKQTRAKG
jgi:hypothetical protein